MGAAMSGANQLRLAVLQHVACEPPAAYSPVLEKYATVDAFLMGRDAVPDLTGYDAVVAMGGPMGAYDRDAFPWLVEETQALEGALRAGVAIWGVCLGAQLLAAAAGASVRPGETAEVGVSAVTLTAAADTDPVFAGMPSPMSVLQWHGDTFDLPNGAVLLATGDVYVNQAFCLGRSYGLQFHLETPLELAEEWLEIPAYRDSLAEACGPTGTDTLRRDLRAQQDELASTAETLMTRWLETLPA
jgi:GMP synthase (glutamine-hydrolysing)